jgi:hypothetical protein
MAGSIPQSAEASATTSTKQDERAAPLNVDDVNEKDIGVPEPNPTAHHKSTRRVSEWEALQIARAGDLETINAEVDEIEAELQLLNLRSTWYKPLLNFRNPQMFNYLLVGKTDRITSECQS